MSNLDEPMLPANEAMHEIESRERLLAWDVPAVAADPEAVKAVIKEYVLRLMLEHGVPAWIEVWLNMLAEAEKAARGEYYSSKIIKEANCV